MKFKLNLRYRLPTRVHAATCALAFLLSAAAFVAAAGAFNETNGVAIDGFDPVAYMTENRAVKGSAEFTHVFKGWYRAK